MLVGPPVAEWLVERVGRRPLVLDVDDAIWLPEQTLVPSLLSKVRRWPHKVDWLLANSTLVTCGNTFLAAYVRSVGQKARVVPNAVDTDVLRPAPERAATGGPPVVGWIGSHSTYSYLETLLPVLEDIARQVPFRMVVVGSNRRSMPLKAVPVELRPFDLAREVRDFASLDVGLYPLADDSWAAGKSGLKAIQYMAVGIPFVASPVGIVAEIGLPGTTHFLATTPAEWRTALMALLQGPALRSEMGASGRRHAESHYSIDQSIGAFESALREATGG
jgi:glycosyltransferase involved in cell wall biosynthesis